MEAEAKHKADRRAGNITYELKGATVTIRQVSKADYLYPRRIKRGGGRLQGRHKVAALVVEEILSESHAELDTYDIERIRRIANSMTRLLPTQKQAAELDMAAKAGPFYQTSTVVEWLGVTRQALSKRAAKRELLAVQDEEGRIYYPDRQFMSDGTVVPGLRQVLDTLATGTPVKWTWALWLAGTSRALNGQTPWAALHNGEVEEVLTAAARDAARWAE